MVAIATQCKDRNIRWISLDVHFFRFFWTKIFGFLVAQKMELRKEKKSGLSRCKTCPEKKWFERGETKIFWSKKIWKSGQSGWSSVYFWLCTGLLLLARLIIMRVCCWNFDLMLINRDIYTNKKCQICARVWISCKILSVKFLSWTNGDQLPTFWRSA